MLNQVNLSDLRTFVLIAQLGNFTKAADQLQVSRSHVSRQISQLEKQLAVTLLIRTTRTLRLTAAGEALFEQCQQAFGHIDQALIAAIDDQEQIKGTIRVNSVGGYIGEELVTTMAHRFMSKNPLVNVVLDFSSHRVDMIEEEFDIAFRMGELDDAGFVARKLFDIEMATLASPQYLAKMGKLDHPKKLSQHRCLTGSVKRWKYQHNQSQQHVDVQVKGQFECKNGRSLLKGAELSNGIARLPKMYCLPQLEQGVLVEVFSDWHIPSVDFSLLYHRDRYQPQRLKAFISFIVDEFERL